MIVYTLEVPAKRRQKISNAERGGAFGPCQGALPRPQRNRKGVASRPPFCFRPCDGGTLAWRGGARMSQSVRLRLIFANRDGTERLLEVPVDRKVLDVKNDLLEDWPEGTFRRAARSAGVCDGRAQALRRW